jgi:hypothetical protein
MVIHELTNIYHQVVDDDQLAAPLYSLVEFLTREKTARLDERVRLFCFASVNELAYCQRAEEEDKLQRNPERHVYLSIIYFFKVETCYDTDLSACNDVNGDVPMKALGLADHCSGVPIGIRIASVKVRFDAQSNVHHETENGAKP